MNDAKPAPIAPIVPAIVETTLPALSGLKAMKKTRKATPPQVSTFFMSGEPPPIVSVLDHDDRHVCCRGVRPDPQATRSLPRKTRREARCHSYNLRPQRSLSTGFTNLG